MKGLTFFLLTLLVCTARFAAADTYDDCLAECAKVETSCVDSITLYDETGVREARQACADQRKACAKTCHDIEDLGKEDYDAGQKRAAEEAERKRKQEEDTVNGNIPVIRFDR